MAAAIHSPLPLMNRLLTIAQEEALKRGHDIPSFTRHVTKDDPVYTGECIICGADAKVTCTVRKYNRSGTAYTTSCKPG